MKKIITKNSKETKNLGKKMSLSFKGGEVICLFGDLGSGKTTFTQGMLEGLHVDGPYTSPTFAILKEYDLQKTNGAINKICHIDTYRVNEGDIIDLGWNDFAGNKNCITIVEWAEKIENIIPFDAVKIYFRWINENEREITFL